MDSTERRVAALVLAGGRGERLHPLTRHRAKPALHFGGAYRLIDFALSNLVNSGVRRIGILTQYCPHSLIRHVQRGWSAEFRGPDTSVEILPASQAFASTDWYSGTADAVFQNLAFLERHRCDQVIVAAGDHVYRADFRELLACHRRSRAGLTIACTTYPRAEARSFGVLRTAEDGRVLDFEEKPEDPAGLPDAPDRSLVSLGIYVFERCLLHSLLQEELGGIATERDFGRHVIPQALASGRVHACRFETAPKTARPFYWRDVGTLDAYYQTSLDLLGPAPLFDLDVPQWPLWTAAWPTPPGSYVASSRAHDSLIAGSCRVIGSTIRRSVLARGIHVDRGTVLTDTVVLPEAQIGEGCQIRRAIIDKRCVVPPQTRIGWDPEEDARRFCVSPAGVVVVTPELLEGPGPGKRQPSPPHLMGVSASGRRP